MQIKNNLTITEILSRAFYLCKDNFFEILKVIGIYVIPSNVLLIVTFFSLFSSIFIFLMFSTTLDLENIIEPTMGIGSILLMAIIIFLITLISGFGSLVIAKILDEANKNNKITWKDATKYIWNKKWSALGLNILIFLILICFFIVLTFLTVLISVITFGFGAIIMIPLAIAIVLISIQFSILINSMFIVRDLNATEAIAESFRVFKKGSFWRNIRVLVSIGGISIIAAIVLYVLQLIPLLGFFIGIIGQCLINAYVFAYLNIFIFDRINEISEFN